MAPKKERQATEEEVFEEAGEGSDVFKLPLPQKFYANKREDKNYSVQAFIFDVKLYLEGMGIAHNSTKAYYVMASLLRGTAKDWLRSTTITTFVDMCDQLLLRFSPMDPAQQARDKLEGLVQLSSVDAYTNIFMNTVMLCKGVSGEEKLSKYVNGLKDHIKSVVKLHLRMAPSSEQTYEKAVSLALQVEQDMPARARVNAMQSASGSGSYGGRSGGGGRSYGGRFGGRSSPTSGGRGRGRGRGKGACWTCGDFGHKAVNCPKANSSGKDAKDAGLN
jgi:uncharacterized membrane protein YgcG